MKKKYFLNANIIDPKNSIDEIGVIIVDEFGKIDFSNTSLTLNTRVSYPIYHIDNIVRPVSKAGHAQHVLFLTADAFGVLPPVSILDDAATQYHFLSGFTAKMAGMERGMTEHQQHFLPVLGRHSCHFTRPPMPRC